ncbi:MAG: MFS transporter [Actinobacteria bacterium]|nr:MFS transporter [Actinomycetota bacterium]
MTAPRSTTSSQLASAWGLLAAMALLMLGNGLQGSLTGYRARLEGFPTLVVGVVMGGYYVGFLIGSMVTPRILKGVGHVRVYAGLASLASTAILIQVVFLDPSAWFAMRVVSGFCLAGLYVVAESWLNGISTNVTRGRLLASYMVVVMGFLAGGQLLLNVSDPASFELFVLASVLLSLAVVPIALARTGAPQLEYPRGLTLKDLFATAPLGMITAMMIGLANAGISGMGAVYAAEAGMTVPQISVFMGLTVAGGIALQWPVGYLSDAFSRRRVIALVAFVAAALAIVAMFLGPGRILFLANTFVFGGLSYSMYSLAVSHVNDLIGAHLLVGASAALIFVNGVGSILGPLAAASAISALGPEGFWVTQSVVHAGLGVYAVYRALKQRQLDILRPHTWDRVPFREP